MSSGFENMVTEKKSGQNFGRDIGQNNLQGLWQDLKLRHGKIANILRKKGIDAILVASNVNLYYCLGEIINGYFYLNADGEAAVFTRRKCSYSGAVMIKKPEEIPELLRGMGLKLPENVTFDDAHITAEEWFRLSGIFKEAHVLTGAGVMRESRMIKTPFEVERIKESALLQSRLYKIIPFLFRRGMTDIEFSAEIERRSRLLGHLGVLRSCGFHMEAFMGTVLAGENGGEPSPFDFALGGRGAHPSLPVGASGEVIRENTTVLVDISGNANGYLSDLSRTYAVGGISNEARRVHEVSMEIQDELQAMSKPGVPCCELWDRAVSIAEKYGLSDCFMGLSQKAKFVGHGLGLEINELPVITKKDATLLEEGMVFALEPKFVIKGTGAVGVEDTYVLTGGGAVCVTDAAREIIVF